MTTHKLSEIQKSRVQRLELLLKNAALRGDLTSAKQIVIDLQSIYVSMGQNARLMRAKNILFETALEANNLVLAEQGFIGIRQKTNNNTRVHLEATALLAICYLRQNKIDKAEPFVREVLKNDYVIRSESKREEFRKFIIERFDEEGILAALNSYKAEGLNHDLLHQEAQKIINRSEEQIFIYIGEAVPQAAKGVLFRLDTFSKNLLPAAERLKLAAPKEMLEDSKIGKTVFSSIKRVLYKYLCDKDSDIYKAWFNNGIEMVLNKKYIAVAVGQALTGLGFGIGAIAISVVALIMKFGIEVYCDRFKSISVMDIR